MKQNKVTALITIFLTFILFVIMQPGDDPLALIRIASIVAGVVIVLGLAYTHLLWRVEPFIRFHHIVDISGRWVGKIPHGDSEIDVEVKIKQHFCDVAVEVFSNKNHSESMVTEIVNDPDGNKLYIVYKTKPNGRVSSKDEIYYGTIMVRMDEDILEGEYFDSNNISGHIELYRKE